MDASRQAHPQAGRGTRSRLQRALVRHIRRTACYRAASIWHPPGKLEAMTFICPPSYCDACGARLTAYERVYQICLRCGVFRKIRDCERAFDGDTSQEGVSTVERNQSPPTPSN